MPFEISDYDRKKILSGEYTEAQINDLRKASLAGEPPSWYANPTMKYPYNTLQTQHPSIGFGERFLIKNTAGGFGNNPEDQQKAIQTRHPEMETKIEKGQLYVRTRGSNEDWMTIDPQTGIDLENPSEMAKDIAEYSPEIALQAALGATTGAIGSKIAPHLLKGLMGLKKTTQLAVPAAGGAAGTYGIETLRDKFAVSRDLRARSRPEEAKLDALVNFAMFFGLGTQATKGQIIKAYDSFNDDQIKKFARVITPENFHENTTRQELQKKLVDYTVERQDGWVMKLLQLPQDSFRYVGNQLSKRHSQTLDNFLENTNKMFEITGNPQKAAGNLARKAYEDVVALKKQTGGIIESFEKNATGFKVDFFDAKKNLRDEIDLYKAIPGKTDLQEKAISQMENTYKKAFERVAPDGTPYEINKADLSTARSIQEQMTAIAEMFSDADKGKNFITLNKARVEAANQIYGDIEKSVANSLSQIPSVKKPGQTLADEYREIKDLYRADLSRFNRFNKLFPVNKSKSHEASFNADALAEMVTRGPGMKDDLREIDRMAKERLGRKDTTHTQEFELISSRHAMYPEEQINLATAKNANPQAPTVARDTGAAASSAAGAPGSVGRAGADVSTVTPRGAAKAIVIGQRLKELALQNPNAIVPRALEKKLPPPVQEALPSIYERFSRAAGIQAPWMHLGSDSMREQPGLLEYLGAPVDPNANKY